MTTREQTMKWWNNLSSLRKTQLCDTSTELVGHVRRWETLTGREIESLYKSQCLHEFTKVIYCTCIQCMNCGSISYHRDHGHTGQQIERIWQ